MKIASHFAVRENGADCWCQLAKKKHTAFHVTRLLTRQQQQNQNNFQERRRKMWKKSAAAYIFSCRVVKENERNFPSTYTSEGKKCSNFIQTFLSRNDVSKRQKQIRNGEHIHLKLAHRWVVQRPCRPHHRSKAQLLLVKLLTRVNVCMCENCHELSWNCNMVGLWLANHNNKHQRY